MTGLFRWPLSQSVFLSLHELVTLALPVLPTRQPLSNLSPAGFSYRNGGLGAGVFPEALLQPGTWAGGASGEIPGSGAVPAFDLFPPPGFPGATGFRNGESD